MSQRRPCVSLFINGISVLVALFLSLPPCVLAVPAKSGAHDKLAPPSKFSQSAQLKKMVVYNLLEAFDLNDPFAKGYTVLSKRTVPTGETLVKIRVPIPVPDHDPAGLEMLYYHLAPTTDYYLLYNDHNRLIAVLPVISKAEHEKKYSGPVRYKWGPVAHYLDFAPYYMEMPKMTDEDIGRKWAEFAAQWRQDERTVERYLGLMFEQIGPVTPVAIKDMVAEEMPDGKDYRLKLAPENEVGHHEYFTESGVVKSLARRRDDRWRPFVYFECPRDGKPVEPGYIAPMKIMRLYPDEFGALQFQLKPDMHQIIIPVYPTVYSPQRVAGEKMELNHNNTDLQLYSALYPGPRVPGFPPQGEGAVIIGGPGCGLDVLLGAYQQQHLQTNRKICAIGRNPLEVANTKELARIAGFETDVRVGDLSSDGAIDRAFPGETFILFYWNMPLVRPDKERFSESFGGYDRIWDQDYGGTILSATLRWLRKNLPDDGRAFIWNGATKDGKSLIMRILQESGLARQEYFISEPVGYHFTGLVVLRNDKTLPTDRGRQTADAVEQCL